MIIVEITKNGMTLMRCELIEILLRRGIAYPYEINVDIVLDDKKLAELDEARGRGVLRFSETVVDPMDDD